MRNLLVFKLSNKNLHESGEDEVVPGTVDTSGGSSSSSIVSSVNEKASGCGKGRNAAKQQKIKEEVMARKRERESKRDKNFSGVVVEAACDIENVMRRRNNSNCWCHATELTSDPKVKAQLEAKLVNLADKKLEFLKQWNNFIERQCDF